MNYTRPDSVSNEDYKLLCDNWEKDCQEAGIGEAHYKYSATVSNHFREIVASGRWLKRILIDDLELEENKVNELSFAHGQRCFAANPWVAAARVLFEAKNNIQQPSKEELAERILLETGFIRQ